MDDAPLILIDTNDNALVPDCVTVQTAGEQPADENVIFPVRDDVEAFAATLIVMLPLPLPDVLLSVSHDASFDTVHDVFDVTVMLYELAEEPTDLLVGETESVGAGATPDCVTVHTCDGPFVAVNVIFPVREDVEAFAATLTVMLPLPLPDVGLSFSHDTFVDTVHDVFDEIVMVNELTVEPTDLLDGEIESERAAPDCVTVQT